MIYSITIPGRPVPKGRPRVGRSGRKYVVYTPRKTRDYEQAVGFTARAACKVPMKGSLAVKIRLYFRKKGRIPDCDNCTKSILDGLNKIAYEDDRQVQHLEVDIYRETPERAEVEIMPLEMVRGEAAL